MPARRPLKIACAALLLAGFGLARMPFEAALARDHRSSGLRGGRLDLAMRDQVSQKLAVAVLGGFRSLVATILSLEAHTAWEYVRWDDVESLCEVTTQLQPGVDHYWRSAAAYLAYDAASYYLYTGDADLPGPVRAQKARAAVERGLAFLEDGFRNNPDSYWIAFEISEIYRKRTVPPDPCRAAEWLGKAAAIEAAPGYFRRFYAYALARCPGREREAYGLLRELFLEGESNRKPTLMRLLGELEEALAVPAGERLVRPAG
jgi:hypothetical protein